MLEQESNRGQFIVSTHISSGDVARSGGVLNLLEQYLAESNPAMRHEFLTVIERIDGTHVAYCPEVPGIFGRGRTKMAALVDLREAVTQALNDRRERGVRDAPKDAVFDSIRVE